MSASAIADGFVTMLSATSVMGAGMVSKNSYQVLETSTGSCAVVQWTNMRSGPSVFGANYQSRRMWTFLIYAFIRDTGQAEAVRNRLWTATDTILTAVENDPTVQGTAFAVRGVTGNYQPEQFVQAGGATWLPASFSVDVEEWMTN
jgi:hypothetical protein